MTDHAFGLAMQAAMLAGCAAARIYMTWCERAHPDRPWWPEVGVVSLGAALVASGLARFLL